MADRAVFDVIFLGVNNFISQRAKIVHRSAGGVVNYQRVDENNSKDKYEGATINLVPVEQMKFFALIIMDSKSKTGDVTHI